MKRNWTESFENGFVYNSVARQLFVMVLPCQNLSSCPNFVPEQVDLNGQWEVAISEVSYPSKYQNDGRKKIWFTMKNYQEQKISTFLSQTYILQLEIF